MEEIKYVEVIFNTHYEPTYIDCIPRWASKTESYYLSKEDYNKVMDFIKKLKNK